MNQNKINLITEEKIKYIDIGSVGSDNTIKNIQEVTLDKAPSRARRRVYSGNSIISTVRTYLKAIAFITDDYDNYVCSTGFAVFEAKKDVYSKYLFYSLLSTEFIDEISRNSVGVSYPAINASEIGNLKIYITDYSKQTVIVNFLNKKLNEINKLISLKENQIELLEEQRQAMITEAVTKGLDSDAEKKESGIEWMGEIPKHWTITKIKYTTYVKGRIGWQGLRSEEFIDDGPYLVTGTDFDNGLINWNGCYHISENRYNEALPIQLKEDDLLITKDGTIGKIAMVKEMPDKAILNSGIFVTRPLRNQYHNNYMFWNLKSSSFSEYIKLLETGSTIKHLYQETFVNYSYALPPIDEQIEISNLLIKKNDEFDKLLLNIKKQLFKLNEYRQALIHEAVTGKIPVDEMEKYLKEVEEDGN